MNTTTTPTQSVVLVGGPDAGKTNYLGRLWMALDAETGVIAKNGLPAQVEYLRGIVSSLNSGVFAQRTAPGVFKSTSIPVKWGGGASLGELVVPTARESSGKNPQRTRVEFQLGAGSRFNGWLHSVFWGTSDHNVGPLNWSNDAEVMKCLQEVVATDGDLPRLPTQVVYVDWLQCLSAGYRDIQCTEQPLRVSIVLSAWDLAPKEAREADPDEYLSTHLPLLHDFLLGNPFLFCPKSFGVSITGGILTDEDTPFMKQYLKEDPSKTGYVVFANGKNV